MFLRAGAVSLALLLASRLLGLLRESVQAAAFGSTGLADVAVLMLSLPDWLAGVLASGAMAYVLVPHWAGQAPGQVAREQRVLAAWVLGAGLVMGLLLAMARGPAVVLLARGLGQDLREAAADGLLWSALALPAALLAALWVTRLHHARDFAGMYGANLVVNASLVAALAWAGLAGGASVVAWLGAGLLAAMVLRLGWLAWRQGRAGGPAELAPAEAPRPLPLPPVWLWAGLSAGLPLALPFAARSLASPGGEGALASFNYAWKLVELPMLLAIQLVATLALPRIAQEFASSRPAAARSPQAGEGGAVPAAFVVAWALACACVAGLLLGAPALASLLFGWGRMEAGALAQIAQWGTAGAWSLLPQALSAVALAVLAAQSRLAPAAAAYGLALLALLVAGRLGVVEGADLMGLLNGLHAAVAFWTLAALGPAHLRSLPWSQLAWPLAALLGVALLPAAGLLQPDALGWATGLAAGALAAAATLAVAWAASPVLRGALRR